MDDAERKQHLAMLKETPKRLKEALKGVPKKLAAWTPAPGKWSILEIVCHLRDMEREAYLERYRRILAEDNPSLPDVDGDLYALEKDYRSQKLTAALREWLALRRETLKLLSGVKSAQWQRVGTHETAGPLGVLGFLQRQAVGNDQAHLGQIEAIKRRHAIFERLEAAPARLSAVLKGASDEALRRPRAPGKWSAIETLCHLRDTERIYTDRITKTAFSERPQYWMMDNDKVAQLLKYREADASAVLKEFRTRRAETIGLLRSLPHPVWQRIGIHPKRGELTIEAIAGLIADHDDSHLEQIRAALGTS